MDIEPFSHFSPLAEAGVLPQNVKMGVNFPVQTLHQVHGTDILEVDALGPEVHGYDAMITRQVNVPLMIKTADCIPLVLAAPGVVAAVHAGWRGLVAGILPKTITAMRADPRLIRVGIGPSLGLCCSAFSAPEEEIPERYHWAIQGRRVDLNAICDHQLEEAGILPEHVERMNECTRCNEKWFSWRRDADERRFGTLIRLVKSG